jgi:hypothetical protein
VVEWTTDEVDVTCVDCDDDACRTDRVVPFHGCVIA